MARSKKKKPARKLAVIDFETDPFLHGRKPQPFAAGFYDGEIYKEFWGDDCVLQLLYYIESLKHPYVIYAHNGGKFDFFYFLEHGVLENPALIIHGRIVKCAFMGMHELRDSYAILPLALSKLGNKLEIEYEKMERAVREKHKVEILHYMKIDCVELWDVIFKFRERFGPKLTIGATAIAQLGKLHYVSRQDEKHDERFRPFYFGGRVECFESGILKGNFKIYDVNSMYPDAMRNYDHPSGKNYIHLGQDARTRFDFRTGELRGFMGMYFMRFIGENDNAIPVRITEGENKGGLSFGQSYGEFFACSHEIKTAIQLGRLRVHEIIDVYIPCNVMRFDEYVDTYIAEKIAAKTAKDVAGEIFAKLLLNSAYGKFATDPRGFKDWYILDTHDSVQCEAFENWRDECREKGNEPELANDMGRFEMWTAPNYDLRGFYDVAVAASITSAARSNLLRAYHNSTRPVYCDTDSLICEAINGVHIDDYALGAWKFEGRGDTVYIAGKKMYSVPLQNGDGTPQLDKQGEQKYKLASKGAKLTHQDIADLCTGKVVYWQSDAPNFKLTGDTKFVSRKLIKNV